jgi:oxygen-independent coproporphyrinogen-3 oxidase
VSAYGLTVEAGTPLAKEPDRHPDPDEQADRYLVADEVLTRAGLGWYEISNWARPGAECRHNRLYWEQGAYEAIGCAAHGHLVRPDGSARRWWNVRTPDRYIRLRAEGRPVEAGAEDLAGPARRLEAAQLALRTSSGVDEAFLADWRSDEVLADLLEPAAEGRVALNVRGRLLANEVALRLQVP